MTFTAQRIYQNQIIGILLNKEKMFPTKHFYEKFNELPVKKIYLKATAIFLKNQNLLQPIIHEIDTRYEKNHFIILDILTILDILK